MMKDSVNPIRSWQQIAEEASREKDGDQLQKLSQELEDALDRDFHSRNPVGDGDWDSGGG